jgi:streptomycin 3"-adenylyltransferase
MTGTDVDLAAHFTNIRAHGKCLYGLPAAEVFGEVPPANYLDSIWNDICDAPDDIAENTMYITLNLPRVLAFQKENILLSKKEGGEWALKNLPESAVRKFAPVIQAALAEYTQNTVPHYNLALAKEYAEYMLAEIKLLGF